MKLTTKLAIGGALTLASVGAFAQTINLPSSGNGSAVLTLFSTNDGTPFSYSFNLGLNFNDLLSPNFQKSGFTESWSLTGLGADLTANPSAVSNGLVFDVTAASQTGGITTVGAFKLATTFDPTVSLATITALQSGGISAAEGHNNTWLTNFGGTNPSFTTNPADVNYANANYGVSLNTFAINAASSTSNALPFYELVSNRGSTSTIQTPLVYAGLWTINLATDTLTYTVGGGSPVPLPAGVWLLISGLAGMFVVARRRKGETAGDAMPVPA